MNWIEIVHQWRSLTPEEKLHRRWEAIPHDVAQSMAFEQEPEELRRLQEILDQIEPPGSLKPNAEVGLTEDNKGNEERRPFSHR